MISNLSSSSFGAEPNALTALFGGSVASAGASVSSSSQAASTSLYNSIHQHPGSVGSFSGHTSSGVSNHFGKPFPAMFGASAGDLLSYSQTSASAFDASLMKGVVSKEHQKSPTSPGSTLSVACSSGGHNSEVCNVNLYGVPIVSLIMDNQERLCLAQISNTLLKNYSYNEIHNRRVALGITCVQCTPVQLELLRRAGAMPVSSRRCGMITKREAERLCKSFLTETSPPKLPENFSFDVYHCCAWGCRGSFTPSRYNSSRAKCIKCIYCGLFFSPNKFIFHSHRLPSSKYIQPDAANFNSWRRHIRLVEQPEPTEQVVYAWEDVKAMFNGGSRKRAINSTLNSFTKNQEQRNAKNSHHKKSKDIDIDNDDDSDSIGITDDLEPQSGKSLCEMTDILDTSGSEEHCGHQPTSSPSPSKSLDSPAVNSSTSKPFWSMESYLNNSPNIIKSRNQLQSATPFGSNSDSLMNSYPFFGRSPLNDSRFPPPHPALLSSLLSTVPENYHFRNSLLGAANGGYPGGSGHTPTDLAKAPSFAELMWSMAARNGASTNPISNNPYHLLWSQSGLGPSQTSATTVRNSTSLGNVAAAAAASLLPHPSLTSHPIPVPTSVATSGTLGSQFDSEEFRKALLMNPTLFQNHRANSDFFQNITTGAPQGNDFPFFPVRPSEMSQFDSGDTRKGHKRAILLSSVDEKLSLEKKIKTVEIDDLVDDSSEIVVTSDSKSIQDLDKDNDGSECDNLQL